MAWLLWSSSASCFSKVIDCGDAAAWPKRKKRDKKQELRSVSLVIDEVMSESFMAFFFPFIQTGF